MPVWPRALVLAATVLGVGSASHVLADGLLPGPAVLLVLLGLTTAAVSPFLRSTVAAGPARLVALTVGGQALVHLALSAAAGHRTSPGASPGAGRVPPPASALQPHTVDGRRVGSLIDQSLPPVAGDGGEGVLAHLVEHVVATGPWMLLAHTAAAIAVGLWLALGERALWDLLVVLALRARRAGAATALRDRLLAGLRAACAVLSSLPDPDLLRLPVAPPRAVGDTGRHHPRAVTRRGPPLLLGS